MSENKDIFDASPFIPNLSSDQAQRLYVVYQDIVSSSELNIFPDNSFTIILLDEGEGTCITDTNKYHLKPKQLFIHLPRRKFVWSLSPNSKGRRLIIKDSIIETFSPPLKQTFSSFNQCEMIHPNDETYEKFSAEFLTIKKELLSEVVFPELLNARVRLIALMVNLWIQHLYGDSALADPESLAFKFHSLVDRHFKTQKSIGFYAEELCITPNYLGIVCRKNYKMSPLEFIKERTLLEAKRLLYSSDKSIKEIAFELGFQNFSYFSYFFRSRTKLTPKAYREMLKKS
ncbi:AraC family transcriptional regulator [Chryseobacterium piperi]|uniref:helix-turn-helix domain-containing protein n=1 Tax=Chryseobacterium piperi TaxID=558152 RepID=UPI0006911CB3|nr:helix-turn-helix domain-containing protein [Chryseobacterium piperi]ASW73921.1 AraC family transcriptional regulator [Chryseobacterium piperi]